MINTEIRLIIFFEPKIEKLFIVNKKKKKKRLGANCGSDHEPLTAKFRNKLKKIGETTNHSGMTKSNPSRLYSGSDK